MGTLFYGSRIALPVEDRTLAHLQYVILAKLRRNETLAFTWRSPLTDGQGRSTLWMHPGADLQFEFTDTGFPPMNREWLRELTVAANSIGGLHLTPEPEDSSSEPVKMKAD